jgi:exopolyphosphatase/guanosine-5'-triphosphate,3'-diphosphate pyrophosphatase
MNRPGMDGRIVTKLSVLRHWASQHLGDVRHERRVSAIASSLARATAPLHSLTRADRWLLAMAATVHDVGRSVNSKRHPAIGAKMILRDEVLPLKKRHRRALAFLTLHHRGRVPDVDGRSILRPGDDAARLRVLLAFLRAADTLDSRSLPAPRLKFLLRGRRLRVICGLRDDSAKARRVFHRPKKFRLLEEMLGCKVELAVGARRRLRLAA